MSPSQTGIDLNEAADPSTIHAYIGTHFDSKYRTAPSAPDIRPISYTVIVVGAGLYEEIWGYGYCTFEDFGRAAALNHADEFRRPGQILVGHCIGLLPHVGPTGTVHAAIPTGLKQDGKTLYDAFDDLSKIALDIKSSRTRVIPCTRRDGPVEVRSALAIAGGDPWARAQKYQPHFSAFFEAYPRNHIIGRNDDPDPLNLL